MLPFYKLLSLFLRVFSRPLINLTKKHHAAHGIKNQYIKAFFFKMGNKFHQFQMFVNRRYLKSDSKSPARQLSEPLAIDKGIQFFYQLIFYSIAIGFPTYELIRAAKDTKKKQQKLKKRVDDLKDKIKLIQSSKKKIDEAVLNNQHLLVFTYELISKTFIGIYTYQHFMFNQKILTFQNNQKFKKQKQDSMGAIRVNRRFNKDVIDMIL